MSNELKSYLRIEMTIAAAFNFFINGMCAALIHHKTDYVATDIISIGIDLTATCLFTFTISALFCRASLKRSKTTGIIETKSRFVRFTSRLFLRPVLFGILMGLTAATILFALTAPVLTLLGINALPFGVYVTLKCIFAAFLGGGVALLELYSGMCRA